MKSPILLCLAVFLSACGTPKPVERGASVAARTSLAAARSKIITAKNRSDDIGRSLATVREVVLQPGTMDKAKALLAVRQAEEDQKKLSNDLDQARAQVETSDMRVDELTQDNARIAAAMAAAEREAEKQAAAKKRWRLIALGLGAVVGFLALKFGLPALSAFA